MPFKIIFAEGFVESCECEYGNQPISLNLKPILLSVGEFDRIIYYSNIAAGNNHEIINFMKYSNNNNKNNENKEINFVEIIQNHIIHMIGIGMICMKIIIKILKQWILKQ